VTLVVNVVAGNFPYGNPGSVGEPLGLWAGEANVTGDASGGFLSLNIEPQNPLATPTLADQRRQYVYFCDGCMIEATTDPGNLSVSIVMHMARSNTALGDRYQYKVARASLTNGQNFVPSGPLIEDFVTRTPLFWDSQELAANTRTLVILRAETNTLATVYLLRAYGRYYDRAILGQRGFGRLIAPAAISQFEG